MKNITKNTYYIHEKETIDRLIKNYNFLPTKTTIKDTYIILTPHEKEVVCTLYNLITELEFEFEVDFESRFLWRKIKLLHDNSIIKGEK
ncbi:MAG: hypothetical protein PHC46_04835 [Clostridia bacterium]|nr:hypothetical protein [Clostridia bacterium]